MQETKEVILFCPLVGKPRTVTRHRLGTCNKNDTCYFDDRIRPCTNPYDGQDVRVSALYAFPYVLNGVIPSETLIGITVELFNALARRLRFRASFRMSRNSVYIVQNRTFTDGSFKQVQKNWCMIWLDELKRGHF